MKEKTHKPDTVVVTYPMMPWYRYGVFSEMHQAALQEGSKVLFCSSPKGHHGIKEIAFEEVREKGAFHWIPIRNVEVVIKHVQFIFYQTRMLKWFFRRDTRAIITLEGIQFLTNWVYFLLGRLTGKKVLIWGHGMYGNERGLKRFLRIMTIRMAHSMLLYDNRAKCLLMPYKPEERLCVIYNSLPEINQTESTLDVAALFPVPARGILVFVGRLVDNKRIDLAVRAVCAMPSGSSNLLVVGDGPLRAALETLAQDLGGADRVRFVGSVYDDGLLNNILGQCAALLSPGNVGLNAIHALRSGIPVITHNRLENQMPEVEAITPGLNGEFFMENDMESLTATIERVVDGREAGKYEQDDCTRVVRERYNARNQARLIFDYLKRID